MRVAGVAAQFLTRLPIPDPGYTSERMAASPRWYPAVGLLIGAVCAVAWVLASWVWPPALAALVAVTLGVVVTGALHEDGLADLCDGLGGGATRARALEIMRDSRIGSYGAVALALSLAARVVAISSLGPAVGAAALVAVGALSRAGIVVTLARLPYARVEGRAAEVAAPGGLGWAVIAASCGLALVPLGILAPGAAVLVLFGAAVGSALVIRLLQRRLGGYTGDGLGAVQQVGELGGLMGVAAWV